MRHLWQVVGDRDTKIRCQLCEEIMTFSLDAYAYEYVATDRSLACEGIPGPKPQNYRQMQEEY